MFKGGNGKTAGPTNSPDKLNRIVEGTSIKGDVKTDSNFRMDGSLEGTLEAAGKLVIGVTGKITGDIFCANADIEGEIHGNIKVDGLLMMKSTAKIIGNVVAGKIGVETGAKFEGNCNMSNAPVEVTNKVVKEQEVKSESEEEQLVY
ncbi:MAG: polymer-forming cytoskeletal protein [Crocinitomicaceae bacterium]